MDQVHGNGGHTKVVHKSRENGQLDVATEGTS